MVYSKKLHSPDEIILGFASFARFSEFYSVRYTPTDVIEMITEAKKYGFKLIERKYLPYPNCYWRLKFNHD